LESDVVQVINRTDVMENMMNQVIINFTSPIDEKKSFFWDVLLDSSIMSLGAKVKVIMAISQELDVRIKSGVFHKVLSLRNAFAHTRISSNPVIVVAKDPKDDKAHYNLKIITQSGKIETMTRCEALNKFNENYAESKNYLSEIISLIKNKKS
jgi:hypothetical protein